MGYLIIFLFLGGPVIFFYLLTRAIRKADAKDKLERDAVMKEWLSNQDKLPKYRVGVLFKDKTIAEGYTSVLEPIYYFDGIGYSSKELAEREAKFIIEGGGYRSGNVFYPTAILAKVWIEKV